MEQKDEVSRLRLGESWVLKVLGSRPIFQAVMKLGWLNRVKSKVFQRGFNNITPKSNRSLALMK
jgi:hypothetical protein